MAPAFEVWESPGGLAWEGADQEEAFLIALRRRRPDVVIEVVEIFDMFDRLRPRRLAHYDDLAPSEATE